MIELFANFGGKLNFLEIIRDIVEVFCATEILLNSQRLII